jgi:hypothetical protein
MDDTPPKNRPDEESLRAAWVSLEEARQMPLRGAEVLEILQYVERGGPVYPLSLLTTEGASWS